MREEAIFLGDLILKPLSAPLDGRWLSQESENFGLLKETEVKVY